jgi:hypothetical protein
MSKPFMGIICHEQLVCIITSYIDPFAYFGTGRIAGQDGKTKFTIENASRTRIVLADTCVHHHSYY